MAGRITFNDKNKYYAQALLIMTAHIRSLFLEGQWQDVSARAGCFKT